jgi:hypothetical protein
MRRLTSALSVAAILGLAGCSGTGSQLTTASIFGGAKPVKPATVVAGTPPVAAAPGAQLAPAPLRPEAQPMQVALTSALAAKCGFHFNPLKLRSDVLAAEAVRNPDPALQSKLEQLYDTTHARVTLALTKKPETCQNEKQVAEIRKDLQRHLAGDFTPNPAINRNKVATGGNWYDWALGDATKPKKMDREKVFKTNY